jgi:hypothetical protein
LKTYDDDYEKDFPEHLREKNTPDYIKNTKNWKRNREITKKIYGFNSDVKREVMKIKKQKAVLQEGSIWSLVNYEAKTEQEISFRNVEEWRFSHIKSANLSHFIATYYSKKRFADKIIKLEHNI